MILPLTPPLTTTPYVPSYSLFAQLLASERLTVRIEESLSTACFIPSKRVLMLPAWVGFSHEAWLLFIAHEVGHALFTPADSLTTHPTVVRLMQTYDPAHVKTVINIFEDIRIERLVRRRFRGLSGVFGRGYHALLSSNFFGFVEHDLTDAVWADKSILDRINIYAKVGALVRQSLLTPQEIAWYNRGLTAHTFDDVLALVEDVLVDLKTSDPSASSTTTTETEHRATDASTTEHRATDASTTEHRATDASTTETEHRATDASTTETEHRATDASTTETEHRADPFAVPSQQSAEQALLDASHRSNPDAPDARAADVLLPTDTAYLHHNDLSLESLLNAWAAPESILRVLHQAVRSQQREQSSILASMVTSFRANQSAWIARRVQVGRTGTIDPTKLAQYKLTEDLFLRRRSLPDAQNHGFVLHVDWSSSMQINIATVLWQVLHLIWFAESIGVPISVYAFSDSGLTTPEFDAWRQTTRAVSRMRGRLIELYRSRASAATKQHAQTLLFAQILWHSNLGAKGLTLNDEGIRQRIQALPRSLQSSMTTVLPHIQQLSETDREDTFFFPHLSLGGTPLYHTLFSSIDTVRAFRQVNRIEQCISVWLTDGVDTNHIVWENPEITTREDIPTQHCKVRRNFVGALRLENQRLIDPRSGRSFTVTDAGLLPTLFDVHRALTGATVICVDISGYPLESVSRVLSRKQISSVAASIGANAEARVIRSGARSRARRGWGGRSGRGRVIPVKLTHQTRKCLVMPTTSKDFTSTGLLVVTRKQYPQIGCDAYLVSHPDWWRAHTSAPSPNMSVRAHEEPAQAWDSSAAEDQANRFRLNVTLLEHQGAIAMRRFTDLLVPYLAVGREDIMQHSA